MFFPKFRNKSTSIDRCSVSVPELSRTDAALIDAFDQVMLEFEIGFGEARALLGTTHLGVDVCRSLNAKERSPSDEERQRMSMLVSMVRMLRAYFVRNANEASDRKQRKFWSNMDSKKWLQQLMLPHASMSAWNMLMIGKLEDMRAIEKAVKAGTEEKK